MALCASGEMSLGGSTTGRSVNLELGRTATTAICMNESAVRTLAARTTGGSAICMADFYGKSNVPLPGALGSAYEGGYYVGVVDIGGGVTYYMILAPNATGCAGSCRWKTTNSSTAGSCSTVNGYLNTYTALNNASHPAGNFTATRSINGFSDWYLPSTTEWTTAFNNRGSLPSGQGFFSGGYWSSVESNSTCAFRMTSIGCTSLIKTACGVARAHRRQKT